MAGRRYEPDAGTGMSEESLISVPVHNRGSVSGRQLSYRAWSCVM